MAIDLVVAWRVFWLAKLAREQPQVAASTYFEPDEWKALLVRTCDHHDPGDDDEPSHYHAMHLIARLGGYQDRKREPGTQTLWRGLQRLDDITDVYRKMAALLHRNDRPP